MIPLPDALREKFEAADTAFSSRPIREKLMIAAMAIGLVFFAIDLIAIQPISTDRNRVEIGKERTREAQAMKQRELAALASGDLSAEERRILEEIQLVREQIDEIEKQMSSEIEGLVPPQAIVSVLEELLEATPGLRLVRLESEPPHRIGAPDPSMGEANPNGSPPESEQSVAGLETLYRHGVRLEIEGDFRSTLDYLERVEQSEWHLMWDSLDYRVEAYPTAIITIDFHTISHSEDWIGV
jgi:MSHA biogenesis protein MshJ